MAPIRSIAWDHFTDKGQGEAECKICKIKFSYKSSVSNLVKHLQRKHTSIQLINRNPKIKSTNNVSIETSEHIQSVVLNNPDLPSGSTHKSETITSYIFKKNTVNKVEIDNLIMDLFIADFQPFRIVEDIAFRNLIHRAFPQYTIPSRKYFSHNLLQSRYEILRNEKMKEIENTVKSICITTDIWTSCKNDSYMAITGHYINDDFVLKSILLECVLCEGCHTSANLAKDLKRVIDEWKLNNKILLAVSDNGANIKKSIEKDLGMKHFSCYAHSLNLAVQSSITSSEEVCLVLDKLRTIAAHFKKVRSSRRKLKIYQEQAGKTALKPLLDIKTRWNSTYYMLSRIIKIKEEINSSLSNLNSTITPLTTAEWKLCEDLCLILKPCEEVTKDISSQKYVSGSLVLPITTGLKKSLESLEHVPLSHITEVFRKVLLQEIKKRFCSLQYSRTFTLYMLLDPRFKLYFEDTNIADLTKKYAINLVTEIINREDMTDRSIEVRSSDECSEVSSDNEVSSVWHHYNNEMQNLRPKGSSSSRATAEVQQYLDDKVLPMSEKISPLDWWKAHQTIYPNLAKIAQTKLNAMATSVPCERIFSAAGLILNNRRTQLSTSTVQELIFLQQNYRNG